jgi:hypothetical protein
MREMVVDVLVVVGDVVVAVMWVAQLSQLCLAMFNVDRSLGA